MALEYTLQRELNRDPTVSERGLSDWATDSGYGVDDDGLFTDLAQAVGIGVASIGTATLNTGIAIGNIFGGEFDEFQTTSFIGDSWEDDYLRSKDAFDLVGTIGSSIVPGTLALKGVKAYAKGSKGIARFFDDGYYRGKQAKLSAIARKQYRDTGSFNKKEFFAKSLGYGVAKGVTEGLAFELGAYASTGFLKDLQNDDLDAIDMAIRAGKAVSVGALFGGTLGGLGTVAVTQSRLTKRIRSGEQHEGLAVIAQPADSGSHIMQARRNMEIIDSRVSDNTSEILRQKNNQNSLIDQHARELVGVDDELFKTVSYVAKESDIETVRSLYTGTRKMTRVTIGADGKAVTRQLTDIPQEVQAHLDDIIDSGVSTASPIQQLVKAVEVGAIKNAGVKRFVASGDYQRYLQTESFVDVQTGKRSLDIPEPFLADTGTLRVDKAGKYLELPSKQRITWAEGSEEVRRIIARDTLVKRGKYTEPDKQDFLYNQPTKYEAMYVRFRDTPVDQLPKNTFPKGIESMDEFEEALVVYKKHKLEEFLSAGKSEAFIEKELGVRANIALDGKATTDDWITIGTHDLTKPRHIRVESNPLSFSLDAQLATAWDLRNTSQLTDFADVTGLKYLQRSKEQMPPFMNDLVAGALGAGAKWFRSAANTGRYLGAEQVMASIGKLTKNTVDSKVAVYKQRMEATFTQMGKDTEAAQEFIHLRDWYDRLGESAVLEGEYLIRQSAIKSFVQDGVESLSKADFLEIKNTKVVKWAKEWNDVASDLAKDKYRISRAMGKHPSYNASHFYMPPKPVKFGAMVYQADGIGANAKIGIVRANSAKELKQLVDNLRVSNPELTVRSIDDLDSYHNATAQFDVSRSFGNKVAPEQARKLGVGGDIKPSVDPKALIDDLQAYMYSTTQYNTRNAMKLTYAKEFSILEDLHIRQGSDARSASKKNIDRFSADSTPAGDAMKTMLDIAPSQPFEALSLANRDLEKFGSRFVNTFTSKVRELVGSREKELLGDHPDMRLSAINKLYEDVPGVRFSDANDLILAANPNVDRAQLQKFLSKVNGWQAMLMLRADGLDGLVNNLSAVVLGSPELKAIMRDLDPNSKDALTKLISLDNGKGLQELSPMKSVLRVMSLLGDPKTMNAKIEKWKAEGRWDSAQHAIDQVSGKINETFESGFKDIAKASKEVDGLWAKVKMAPFLISDKLNDHAQMQVLQLIDDIGVAAGLNEGQVYVLSHTMKSRVLGFNIPSQKPTLFQGVIGTPISLYQNYNFNVLAGMLRYAGTKGDLKRFALLQTGVFGAQGLPGFEQLNEAVHDIYGKDNGQDLKSIIYNTTGSEASKWLLYGSGSGAVDAALYSRGDLNQRNRFILPSFEDIPTVRTIGNITAASTGTFDNIVNGAPIGASIADGLAHSQLNRPLVGIIDTLRGYSTTSKGKLAQENDAEEKTWRANGARLLGARPFEEALLRERVWKLGQYQMDAQRDLSLIGRAVNLTLLSNDGRGLTQPQYDRFFKRFLQMGKSPDDFDKWFKRIEKGVSKDAVERLETKIRSSKYYEQYQRFFD